MAARSRERRRARTWRSVSGAAPGLLARAAPARAAPAVRPLRRTCRRAAPRRGCRSPPPSRELWPAPRQPASAWRS
eukprot:7388650-Pyramimonas_sp.AAC.1